MFNADQDVIYHYDSTALQIIRQIPVRESRYRHGQVDSK
jgi:hypothetical protein